MTLRTNVWFLGFCTVLGACQATKGTYQTQKKPSMECTPNLKEGIAGRVLWREGNWMPSPNAPERKAQGIAREVYAYELTNEAQTEKKGQFYTLIRSRLVAKTYSDDKGCFQLSLPPGRYSLFVKETDGWFANRFDGGGYIQPVEVKTGAVSEVELIVDYKAVY